MSRLGGGGSAHGLGVVSDKPQQVQQRKQQLRLKREDHLHVKHDDCFSDWKILVGPTDWKEHASGKIPDRFRIGNLPRKDSTSTGLYELGVTPPAWQRSQGFLKPQDVVVVYLGSSENVHQRLLKYGQTGAHLEGTRSTRLFAVKSERGPEVGSLERNLSLERDVSRPISNASEEEVRTSESSRSPSRGPRLFSEVFALGCSIAFRWTATDSKADAERAEAALIEHFDYAWKRGGNFRQRSPDILSKIVSSHSDDASSSSSCCFMWLFFPRPGVAIPARRPAEASTSTTSTGTGTGTRAFALFRSSSSSSKSAKQSEFTKFDIPLDRCDAPLCHALPVKGGKRCHLHKDLKSKSAIAPNPQQLPEGAESPILPAPEPRPAPRGYSSCFPSLLLSPAAAAAAPSPASPSSPPEPKRRGSLSFTSWLRTSEIRVVAMNANATSRTETGPKRSSGSAFNSILTTCDENESPLRSPSRSRREICGLRLEDGTVCPDPPRPDRKRCGAHKGLRNQAPRSVAMPTPVSPVTVRLTPMSPKHVVANAGFW